MAASMYQTLTTALGFIHLPLHEWRLIAADEIPAIAVLSSNGGKLASDTAPALIRVNAATDKAERILWAATGVVEITQMFQYPPDMDVTTTFALKLLMAKDTNTDTAAVVTAGFFEGVGDTTRGGDTAALAVATAATYSVTITPTTGYPNQAAVTLTPGAHDNDAIYLYQAYIVYKKKILTS